MAASSSDESCTVPTDFDISSSTEDSNGKYCFTCERCPLCLAVKRAYYCKDCIVNGTFVHSPYLQNKESFFEKKSKLFHMKRERLLLLSKVSTEYEEKTTGEKIKMQIAECREKIIQLKLTIKDKKKEVEKIMNSVVEMKRECKSVRDGFPLIFKRISRIQNGTEKQAKATNQQKNELHALKIVTKNDIRLRVSELVQYIFPISRIRLDEPQEDSLNQETISALAEATQTAFVSGRWVYTENSRKLSYRIVEPLIPANGDYSAYCEYVEANRDLVPSTGVTQKQAHGIITALTYITQLVTVLSFYLDVWLPHRICHSDFCIQELSPKEFEGLVGKLNANVVHLCLSQNVNPEFLRAKRTAANLALLLDPTSCDLGRFEPMDVSFDLFIEDLNVEIDYSPDSDDEVESLGDWVKVEESFGISPRCISSVMGATKQTKHQNLPSDAMTSTAGGLVQSAAASFFSFLRAATGQK
ncbi:hypothetical protein CHUAL_003726 [Chamberlinius hualienensis]